MAFTGYNHSGRFGQVNFLRGIMGLANAQRALNYIRIITEFISQPEWKDVIPMFGFVNEPMLASIGPDTLRSLCVPPLDGCVDILTLFQQLCRGPRTCP